jgi:MFS superfamily sulfate permease-like transporter
MGVRTQVAGLVAVVTVAVVLLFLTEPIQYLPMGTLGAVIVSAAIGLIEVRAWRALWRPTKPDAIIAAVTTVGVVVVGVLEALLLAVVLSIVDTVRRSARPHDAVLGYVPRLGRYADVSLHPSAQLAPGILVYRLDDRLFFANSRYVKGRIREALDGSASPVRWVVFDAESLVGVDATGLEALEETVRALETDGIVFAVARLKGHVREVFDRSGLTDTIGRRRFFPTVSGAVEAAPASPKAPPTSNGRETT